MVLRCSDAFSANEMRFYPSPGVGNNDGLSRPRGEKGRDAAMLSRNFRSCLWLLVPVAATSASHCREPIVLSSEAAPKRGARCCAKRDPPRKRLDGGEDLGALGTCGGSSGDTPGALMR